MTDEFEFSPHVRVTLHDLLDSAIAAYAKNEAPVCESPIEAMFAVAWRILNRLGNYRCEMENQAPIDGFRVDFLLTYKDRSCIVECDGREFHHTSWEQIEADRLRDAKLEKLGNKVFRFPGTQIYSDALKCAFTTLEYLRSDAVQPRQEAAE